MEISEAEIGIHTILSDFRSMIYISIINHFTIFKFTSFLLCCAVKQPSSWCFQGCYCFHTLTSERFFLKQHFCFSSKQNFICTAKWSECSCLQAHFATHLNLSCTFLITHNLLVFGLEFFYFLSHIVKANLLL